jgi:hypothetical protein
MSQEKLYSVVLEYNGGTYIAQVSGESYRAVLPRWISSLDQRNLASWGIGHSELIQVAGSDEPTAIDGCTNIWCVTGSAKKGLVLINIIATESKPEC